MGRIRGLNRYQKWILLFMLAIVLVFTVVYTMTISRTGFAYKDTILIPRQENGSTLYSGKIQGIQAYFTVSADNTVVFQCGNKTYGPYSAAEDITAIPRNKEETEEMTGVELFKGEEILFRGGVLERGDNLVLYNKDGTFYENSAISIETNYGVVDEKGNIMDTVEPTASVILDLMRGPKLTHKGDWLTWLGAVGICLLNTICIFFADELFYFALSFRISDIGNAEPSDWEIAGRYIGWTAIPIIALYLFITGLQ